MSEEIKLNAVDMGFDATWIADILQNYGADALNIAMEAARQGLSVSLIVEALQKFGPPLLAFIVDLLNHQTMSMAMAAPVVVEPFVPGPSDPVSVVPTPTTINSNVVNVIIDKYLPVLIEQYLPQLVEKFGPQLLQVLITLLAKKK